MVIEYCLFVRLGSSVCTPSIQTNLLYILNATKKINLIIANVSIGKMKDNWVLFFKNQKDLENKNGIQNYEIL